MASSNERKLFRVSVICILIIAVIMSMIISLIWGSTPVSLAEIWHTLWSSELTDTSLSLIHIYCNETRPCYAARRTGYQSRAPGNDENSF